MCILEIEELKKGRLLIHTDGVGTFPLYQKEADTWGISEGVELSDEKWESLCEEVLRKRVIRRALHLLEQMDRTESQLRRKLAENHYPETLIEDAMAYVRSYHYIDDFRYASTYIRYHQTSKSKLQMQVALRQRGVASDLIEQAFEEEYADRGMNLDEDGQADQEEFLIQKLLRKKHYDSESMDSKEKYRIYQYLLRKGFPNSKIKRQMHLT